MKNFPTMMRAVFVISLISSSVSFSARGGSYTSSYIKTIASSTIKKSIPLTPENLWNTGASSQRKCDLRYAYRKGAGTELIYLFSNYLSHHDSPHLSSQDCIYFYNQALERKVLAADITTNLELWENREEGEVWEVEQCFVSLKFQTEGLGVVVLMGPAPQAVCAQHQQDDAGSTYK